jgi:hypothetical protein
MWHSILCHNSSYVWDLVPAHLVIMFAPGSWCPETRVWQWSFRLRPRLNLLLSALPGWLAQQSERGERRCFPVRSVSERAKWLRSLRPCRLRRACQDKVSGDPRIECACDTVGWKGDLAKVASRWSLPELGLGRAEGAPTAWGGPRVRRNFVRTTVPARGWARARQDRVPWVDETLTWTVPISLCGLCWGWLTAVFRSVGGTPNYGTRQLQHQLCLYYVFLHHVL